MYQLKLLKGLCDKTHRNPANMISKLIDSHLTYLSKKEQIKLEDLKDQLSKGQR